MDLGLNITAVILYLVRFWKLMPFCLTGKPLTTVNISNIMFYTINTYDFVYHFKRKERKGSKKTPHFVNIFSDTEQDRKANNNKKTNLITFLEMHSHLFFSFNCYCALCIGLRFSLRTSGSIGQDLRKEFSPENF